MRVMVLVKASKDSEAGKMPSQQLLTEMGKYNEELVKAGIMLAGEGLQPSSKGVRVRFSGPKRTAIDGPFAETKELVAGFWIWQVKSMDEAIAWLKRCPNPMNEESEVEIRPIFSPEDFGAAFTPELQEQEKRMRAEVEGYQLDPPRFEDASELLIAGLNVTYTFETRNNIPAQWEKFAPRIGKISGQVGRNAYGVCWNYKPGVGFDYLTGVQVAGTTGSPADFNHVLLPSARYAVFTHRNHVSVIPKTMDAIWKKWLPNSGFEATGTPSFERYTEEFNPQTGMGGTEIWMPIKVAGPMSDATKPTAVASTQRLLSVSPRKVFAAFEQAHRLAQWWGPNGFTNTFEQFEFTPGGRWVFVMHGPNGANYPNEAVFREIQPDTKIVIGHVSQPRFMLTITLTARGDKTHMTWVQEFESPEVAARMRPICEPANEQNLDRLQSLLARESS